MGGIRDHGIESEPANIDLCHDRLGDVGHRGVRLAGLWLVIAARFDAISLNIGWRRPGEGRRKLRLLLPWELILTYR